MLNREEAVQFINDNVKNENLIKHMYATEAIMRALARELEQDEERWGIAGLIHDVDIDKLGDDMSKHSLVSAEMAKEKGVDDEMAQAIAAHNEVHGLPRETLMAKALYACDPLTGMITAVALVRPEKKVEFVKMKSVKKRLKEKRFAAGANREAMASCESELGIPIERFIEIGIEAMTGIADDLGL